VRWLARDRAPSRAVLDDWARESGLPQRFVEAPDALAALDYERRIASHGEIATRDGVLHDLFNALSWLAFPQTKAALNALHVREGASATGNARNRRRDAATLLDESGLIVACADPSLIDGWRRHAWRETFWTRRADIERALAAHALGHGLLEKLSNPYRSITAHALVLSVPSSMSRADVDAVAADRIAAGVEPCALLPLPVAALPGWDSEALGSALFDDVSVFRAPRAAPARGAQE